MCDKNIRKAITALTLGVMLGGLGWLMVGGIWAQNQALRRAAKEHALNAREARESSEREINGWRQQSEMYRDCWYAARRQTLNLPPSEWWKPFQDVWSLYGHDIPYCRQIVMSQGGFVCVENDPNSWYPWPKEK